MFFSKIIKLIFPSKCVLCEKIIEDEDTLCKECWENVKFIENPCCNKCSSPLEFQINDDDICLSCIKNKPLYIKSKSAVVYNESVARIIFKFKFYDKIHLKKFISKCMIMGSKDIINNVDILIPIPLHKKRLIHRKYNQSLLLANEIAKITKKDILYDFLYKKKNTIPQAKLRQKARIDNLKNKFAIREKYLTQIENYKNLNFAIIDDVMTTGSTINECIKTLNEAGIKNVYSITFAKTCI